MPRLFAGTDRRRSGDARTHQAIRKIRFLTVFELGIADALSHVCPGLRALAFCPLRLARGWCVALPAVIISSAANITQRILLTVRAAQTLAAFDIGHDISPL
jgi:hypothetical protein